MPKKVFNITNKIYRGTFVEILSSLRLINYINVAQFPKALSNTSVFVLTFLAALGVSSSIHSVQDAVYVCIASRW